MEGVISGGRGQQPSPIQDLTAISSAWQCCVALVPVGITPDEGCMCLEVLQGLTSGRRNSLVLNGARVFVCAGWSVIYLAC